ncbi:MAG: hypothetical protein JW895_18280 [Thermoleophilaceae bacterium]|nr:hypothetical protein [Thermoleophilaceae bacterium]
MDWLVRRYSVALILPSAVALAASGSSACHVAVSDPDAADAAGDGDADAGADGDEDRPGGDAEAGNDDGVGEADDVPPDAWYSCRPGDCGETGPGLSEYVCDIHSCDPDAVGVCTARPISCDFFLYDPVCTCDGWTMPNGCERVHLGLALDHDGLCVDCQPTCRGGTEWVSCRGDRICLADCGSCDIECRAPGSLGEGWYAVCDDPTANEGCQGAGLIVYGRCPS